MNNDLKTERIIRLMQQDDSIDAPADAVKWAKNLFRTRIVEPKKSVVQKILAVLQVDLAPDKAAFGERSASASQVGQMLFEAGNHAVDLRIKETETGFSLHGQILGEGFENAKVLLFNDTDNFKTEANDLSEFKLDEIVAGSYTFQVTGAESEIVIEELKLQSEPPA